MERLIKLIYWSFACVRRVKVCIKNILESSPVFSLREGYRFKYKELVKLNKNGEFACVRRVKAYHC